LAEPTERSFFGVSELPVRDVVLVPSQARCRVLRWGTHCSFLLGLGLASYLLPAIAPALAPGAAAIDTGPVLAAAGTCALGGLMALALAGGSRRLAGAAPRRIHLGGARVEHVGTARIVQQCASERVVVWHDATDPQSFRRLAALARRSHGGTLR
jgi:hypothetical protein